MQAVIHKANVPPGGYYVYVDPETHVELRHPYFRQIVENAAQHRRANNLPVGSNFEVDVEQNVCAHAAGGVCREEKTPDVWEKMSSFARASWQWARNGMQTVSEQTYNGRLSICQRCEYFSGEQYFGTGGCKKCGCGISLKLYWPTEKCPVGKWKESK